MEMGECGMPGRALGKADELNGGVRGRNRAGVMQGRLNEPACEMGVSKCD